MARKTPKVDGCALCEDYLCCPEHCCDWDDCKCTDCPNCGARGLATGHLESSIEVDADAKPAPVADDRTAGATHASLMDGLDDELSSPKSPPPKHTAYVINGLETNIAAGSGLRCIRWLADNEGCT